MQISERRLKISKKRVSAHNRREITHQESEEYRAYMRQLRKKNKQKPIRLEKYN